MTDNKAISTLIHFSVMQLGLSERGRKIRTDLLKFIEGPFGAADSHNVTAVIDLLEAMRDGYNGSVIEALRGE